MLYSGLVDTVLKSLTGKQLVKGVKVYNNLVREFDGDIGSVIDRMATVASNNLQPLLDMVKMQKLEYELLRRNLNYYVITFPMSLKINIPSKGIKFLAS